MAPVTIRNIQEQKFAVVDHFVPRECASLALSFMQTSLAADLISTKVGRGIGIMAIPSHRGDLRAWVTTSAVEAYMSATDSDRAASAGKAAYQDVLRAMMHLQRLVATRLPGSGVMMPSSAQSELQVTQYPGNGARYVRHLDTFADSASSTQATGRRVTAIVYLNPHWKPTDGGLLRIHKSMSDECPGFVDVEPVAGRAVIFLSDCVPHEVLPCAAERWAISLWMHGRPPVGTTPDEAKPFSGLAASQARAGDATSGPIGCSPKELPDGVVEAGFVVPRASWLCDVSPPAEHTGRLFVAIPAYREPEVHMTLQSLFEAARDPSRIRVGLVVQASKADRKTVTAPHECLLSPEAQDWAASSVRFMFCDSAEAAGPTWARALCWSMWKGEPYVLGIDAHTRMVQGFDDLLIDQLCRAERAQRLAGGGDATRAVLSTYPAAYRWKTTEAPAEHVLVMRSALELSTCMHCSNPRDSNGLVRFASRHWAHPDLPSSLGDDVAKAGVLGLPEGNRTDVAAGDPILSQGWAAGFTFSRSSLWQDVPPDPAMRFLFVGEEASTLVRMLSRGYQVFAPGMPICLHRWERTGRPSFREHSTGWRTAMGIAARRAVRKLLAQATLCKTSAAAASSASCSSTIASLPWPACQDGDGVGVPAGGYGCDDCSAECSFDGAEDAATLEQARTAGAGERVKQWMGDAMMAVVGPEREPGGRYGIGRIPCSTILAEWGWLPPCPATE